VLICGFEDCYRSSADTLFSLDRTFPLVVSSLGQASEAGEIDTETGLSVANLFDQEVQSVVGRNKLAILEMTEWQDKQNSEDEFIKAFVSNLEHWNVELGKTNDTVQAMKEPTMGQIATMTAL